MHMPAQSAAAAELTNAIYNTPVGDEADSLVDGIMENVSPEVIATCLMTRASNADSHKSAMILIAERDCAAAAQDEAPSNTENKAANQQSNQSLAGSSHRSKETHARVNSAALGDKMFRSRHETLKAANTQRDATDGKLCQSIAHHFRKFCLEHPSMLSEVWPQPPANKIGVWSCEMLCTTSGNRVMFVVTCL
jgi:hypothetical protein